jgi:phage tail sheath gpL-like
MAIKFNNIPDTVRTPNVYTEIDNSRALGNNLVQIPHKALVIGQRTTEGSVEPEVLIAITRDNLADGYFGPGAQLARMCNLFKKANPNTELYAMALSDAAGAAKASGAIQTSIALSATGGSCSGGGAYYLLVNGIAAEVALTSAWSVTDVNSAIVTKINADSTLPVTASTNATSAVNIIAVNAGTNGNYIDFRANYYTGQSDPLCFIDSATIAGMAGGTTDPSLANVWAIIDDTRFNYITQPYIDAANLLEIETELATRFGPLVNQQGHGFTCVRGTQASCTTLGNSRNSPHNTIFGIYDSPNDPAEWAAVATAVAAYNLNIDPARPLHFLQLPNLLPPPVENRFTRAERDILLYDGIATTIVDSGGNVQIERCITTYQTNAAGITDPSYLDIQTLATLGEIRDQFLARMILRFIAPRFKLADDGFPVQPGSNVVTPSTIKQEIISLFATLRDQGLIENLDDFIENLIVERDAADVNRVNCLLPPDLINQFRVLAANLQYIL